MPGLLDRDLEAVVCLTVRESEPRNVFAILIDHVAVVDGLDVADDLVAHIQIGMLGVLEVSTDAIEVLVYVSQKFDDPLLALVSRDLVISVERFFQRLCYLNR